ncbi:astacin-like protein, partial [Leptotrombidium deliense]
MPRGFKHTIFQRKLDIYEKHIVTYNDDFQLKADWVKYDISEPDGRFVSGATNLWIPISGIQTQHYRLSDIRYTANGKNYQVPMIYNNRLVIRYKFRNFNTWSEAKIDSVHSALQEIQQHTCLFFWRIHETTRIPSNFKYISFKSGDDQCSATVGRRTSSNYVNVGGCQSDAAVLHETMHAMGFSHEHQRPNRDKYIRVNYNNIPSGQHSQFKKLTRGYKDGAYITPNIYNSIWGYDYYSMMHYGAFYQVEGITGAAYRVLRRDINIYDIGIGITGYKELTWRDIGRLGYYYG